MRDLQIIAGSVLLFAAPAWGQSQINEPWLDCYRDLKPPPSSSLVTPELADRLRECRETSTVASRGTCKISGETSSGVERIRQVAIYGDGIEACRRKADLYRVNPFVYEAIALLNDYEQRLPYPPHKIDNMVNGAELLGLGLSRAPHPAAKTIGAALTLGAPAVSLTYNLTGQREEYNALLDSLKERLKLKFERFPEKSPAQLVTEFMHEVRDPRWSADLGVVSPESILLLQLAAGQMTEQLDDKALAELRRTASTSRSRTTAERQRRNDREVKAKSGRAAKEAREADRLMLHRVSDGIPAAIANLLKDADGSIGQLELTRFGALDPKHRSELFAAYAALDPASRARVRAGQGDVRFGSLTGLSEIQIKDLDDRARRQREAQELAGEWRTYRDNAQAMLNISRTLNIGDADFQASLELGSLLFDRGSAFLDVMGSAGPLTFTNGLGLASIGASLIGGFSAFGGRNADRDAADRRFQIQVLEAIQKLSQQMEANQRENRAQFARINLKLDHSLLLATSPFKISVDGCANATNRFSLDQATSRKDIFARLKEGDARSVLHECYDFLRRTGAQALDDPNLKLDAQMIADATATLLGRSDPDTFENVEYFLSSTYAHAYLPIVRQAATDPLDRPSAPVDKVRPSLLSMLFAPATTVQALDAKMEPVLAATTTQPDLNIILRQIDPRTYTWTVDQWLERPIATLRANALSQALVRTAPFYLYLRATGEPMLEGTNSATFEEQSQQRRIERDSMRRDYAKLALRASMQETILSGDLMLPVIVRATAARDCSAIDADLARSGQMETLAEEIRLTYQSCQILFHNPVVRANAVIWGLSSAGSPWAKGRAPIANKRLSYTLAFGSPDRAIMDRLLDPARILHLKRGAAPNASKIFYYRIAGDCSGVTDEWQVAADYRPDSSSASRVRLRELGELGASDDVRDANRPEWERQKLKSCLAAPLPDPQSLYEGRLHIPPSAELAHYLKTRLMFEAISTRIAAHRETGDGYIRQLILEGVEQ